MTKETKLIRLLKDIEKYKFNWSCDCKSCLKIRDKIIKEIENGK